MHRPTAALLIVCVAALTLPFGLIADEPTTQPAELPFTISPETTYFTEPLNDDGTVNYLAAVNAIYSEGVTPDNNAAVLMIEVIGLGSSLSGSDEGGVQAAILQQIGAEIPDEGTPFIPLHDLAEQVRGLYASDALADLDEMELAMAGPVSAEQAPLVTRWVEVNDEALAILHEASGRNEWFVPLIPNPHFLEAYRGISDAIEDSRLQHTPAPESLPDFLSAGESLVWITRALLPAKALVCRGNLRFFDGRLDEGFADILTARRLGALVGGGPYTLDTFAGLTICHYADRAAMAMVSSVPLSERTARAFLAQWGQLPESPSLADDLDHAERWSNLDVICWGAQHPEDFRRYQARLIIISSFIAPHLYGSSGALPEVSWIAPEHAETVRGLLARTHWDRVLRAVNAHFDHLVETVELPVDQRTERLAELDIRTQQRLAHANDLTGALDHSTGGAQDTATEWTINAFLSAPMMRFANPVGRADQAIAEHRLVRIALALAVYRAESGGYPDSLDALSPDIIDEVGFDSFSGQPYVYERTDGGYVLYSVGMDLTDDGGSDDDDIVIRVGQP